MREVAPEVIAAWAQNDEQLRALRAAGPTSVIAVPLQAHDALLGVLTLISTAARRFEPADLRLAEELARRIALSIENARLYLAARRAIRERDDVLGIVAHDLRNPLEQHPDAGQGARDAGAASRRRPAPASPAGAIERAATRMNRLIQDLLDVTRLEAGQLAIEPARVATSQVVADALEAQRPLAAAASCALRGELGHDLPDVWADRDRLLQVFENLIGNALKFTDAGGQVTVGATPRDGEVLFWVADTGCGMTPEEVCAPLRPVLAGAQGRQARRRPRAADRQGHRRGPRRAHLGRDHRGRRQHVLLHAPDRAALVAAPDPVAAARFVSGVRLALP